jgi:hypothetical protein
MPGPLVDVDAANPALVYAHEVLATQYETYMGTDGQQHKSRLASSSMELVVKATAGTVVTIKFDKNFAKKHLFTYTKKPVTNMHLLDMTPEEFAALPGKAVAANEAKLLRQAKHRTPEEQRLLCKHCGHEESRHKTNSGNAAAQCKAKMPDGATQCPCTETNPFQAVDPVALYEKHRTAKGKPTANPLAGATTAKTTYIILNEIPRQKFENVVADSILAHNTWAANGEHIDWNFAIPGCVVTVDTSQPPAGWAKARGATVVVKNLTTDPGKPTYQVVHFHATIG